MEEDDFDWTFLNDDGAVERYVNDLFAFRVLLLRNEDVDVQVVKLMDKLCLAYMIDEHFIGRKNTVEMVVANEKDDILCPYFKIIMNNYLETEPVNYKLETFFRTTGVLGIHARCSVALVVGLMSNVNPDSMVDVPIEYYYTCARPLEITGPVDMFSHQSIMRKRCLDKLMDVPGMPLPAVLPSSVHWHIFKYLRHPCAQLILDHRQQMLTWLYYWDIHFNMLFDSLPTWQA